MRIAFFDTKEYDIESFDNLIKENNIEVKYFESKLTEDNANLIKGFDGVCVFVNDQLNKKVIDELYQNGVKAIFLRCAGFNNVDLKAAFGKIHVYRVPAYSPYAVAEHAMALYLTSNRRIHKAYNRVREYNFSLSGLTGNDLHGKTVGVIGTGKIGRIFINICKGFGMNVIAYDLYPIEGSDIKYVSSPETTHIINKYSIALMKKGVAIINTSRGALINSNDLLQGIKDRKIGTVCLDVYEEEGSLFFENKSGHIMDDSTLLQLIAMPNVLITSHQAFLTKEALINIAETTIDNIIKFANDELNTNDEVCYRCGNQNNCAKKRKEKCF